MSYCRWSSMNWACDLYVYENVYDCWTIHVAGSRYTESPDKAPPLVLLDDEGRVAQMGRPTPESWAAQDEWRAKTMVSIDLPHAGETFNLATPGECADKIEELVALGYVCPDYVVPELRAEQAEIDAKEIVP